MEQKTINKYVGLIPVAAILLVLALTLGLGLRGQFVFNSPYVLLALSLLFYWLVTPVVSFFSAKAYLRTGSLTLLFVSLAFLVGVPFSLATAGATSSPNETVTLGALGLLVSSIFQFLGAAQGSFRSVRVGATNRRLKLMLAFTGALLLSLLIIALSFLRVLPLFFVQDVGVTLIDEVVYGLIILFFLVGSLLYLRLYLNSKSGILYWYSLALLLYAIGSFGLTQQLVFGDIVVWTGRISTYIGLLYFLFAFLSSRERNT